MNETELVERCGKGDNLARKQLYERYAGQLMAICVRYTGDREVAQDVLHDGFLNIFRSFSQFTYKGVSIRPRACFFPLFSFLPLWLHYNLNPLCVQY